MPISGGKYVAPTWHNNAAPAIDAAELQAMSDTLAALQTPGSNAKLQFVAKYVTAGSFQFSVPETGDYIALIIGGGGSGGVEINTRLYGPTGGGSGFVNFFRGNLTQKQQIAVVVGTGGARVSALNTTLDIADGKDGGSSSFNGIVAEGGKGGNANQNYQEAALGGQPAPSPRGWSYGMPAFGGVPVPAGQSDSAETAAGYMLPTGLFTDENGLPATMLCAGGGMEDVYPTLPNGNIGSSGAYGQNATATTPTDPGAGGGSAAWDSSDGSGSARSAPGAPGGVFIYRIMGGAA